MSDGIPFGPTGRLIFDRTYSRIKPDGTKETWPETVERVVDGNLALVDERHQLLGEREDLIRLMQDFKIVPAGRHLWASGVKNAQHLFNCWVAGWTEKPSDHFAFTFMRLMEGGGVGASYSNSNLSDYPPVQQELYVHIVCDEEHQDYQAMKDAGVLSEEYDADWAGAFIVEDSREGWAAALVDLIDTHYRDEVTHFQRVYDVSRVRPAGAKLKTFGGRASGPQPLARMLIDVTDNLSALTVGYDQLDGITAMEIDHAIAQCVVAGGVRRSARMAMMHWEDSQIREFLDIKQTSGSHWTTNISVEIDAKFWAALRGEKGDWSDTILPNDFSYANDIGYNAWDGKSTTTQGWAKHVLDAISTGMVLNGEPGFWDSSLSNVGEPNPVVCTNPCGEITLQEWEPCNLGHVNLAGFVREDTNKVDWLGLFKAHTLMTRFLIRATFSEVGDPKSAEVLARNRRIGVGHFGVASFLALTKRKYSEAPVKGSFRSDLRELAKEVDRAATEFCHELRIPVPVKKRTVAPTGTIAKLSGHSEGIHAIFAKYFDRRVRFSTTDPDQLNQLAELEEQGYHVENDLFAANTMVVTIPTKDTLVQEVVDRYGRDAEDLVEAQSDLTLHQMLSFQAMYQECWADNAVSFTANVDPDRYTAADVAQTISEFGGRLKGATLFPEKSFPQAPYTRITKAEYDAAKAKTVEDGVDPDCSSGSCPVK